MDIEIGCGLGNIKFGMDVPSVIALLGPPDKEYETDFNRHLQYYKHKMDLWFVADETDKYNGKLHWVETSYPDTTLFGVNIIGLTKKAFNEFIRENLQGEIEIEDYGAFESYQFKETELEVQIEYGVVHAINFGNLYDAYDEPVWP